MLVVENKEVNEKVLVQCAPGSGLFCLTSLLFLSEIIAIKDRTWKYVVLLLCLFYANCVYGRGILFVFLITVVILILIYDKKDIVQTSLIKFNYSIHWDIGFHWNGFEDILKHFTQINL